MANGGVAVGEGSSERWRVEVRHIDHDGGGDGNRGAFVELVVDVEVLAFRIEPALMAVARVGISGVRKLHRVRLVGDINDVEASISVAVVGSAAAEGDLAIGVWAAGKGLDHHLVDIDRRPGVDIGGRGGVGVEVVDAQAIGATAGAIEKSTHLVERQRVGGGGSGGRRSDAVHQGHSAQRIKLTHIDDLHAAAALGAGVTEVAVDAHIAPEAGRPRDVRLDHCSTRVGDVDERSAVGEADDRVLAAGGRDVAPAGVGAGGWGGKLRERKPTAQSDAVGVEGARDRTFDRLAINLAPTRPAIGLLAVANLAIVVMGKQRCAHHDVGDDDHPKKQLEWDEAQKNGTREDGAREYTILGYRLRGRDHGQSS